MRINKDKGILLYLFIVSVLLVIVFMYQGFWMFLFVYLFNGFLIYILPPHDSDVVSLWRTVLLWYPVMLFDKSEWVQK